jgi:regulator of protease activity HflC (stomatin/prohibitin superfamily)
VGTQHAETPAHRGRLGPGRHAFWRGLGALRIASIDRREKSADVAGQEIMTSDKVTLRVNLVVTYQVTDALKAVTTVSDHDQSLYREAQLVLRAAVGTRTLDAILSDKESVGGEVLRALVGRASEFGVTVRSVGLKDIILPGEMKLILNQVIQAEKQAQADLIRRREETAAARSQANTARLLAENPCWRASRSSSSSRASSPAPRRPSSSAPATSPTRSARW